MSHPSLQNRGFSLVEITIALGIVAFALVAIMGLFPVAMKNATESQVETRATFIAQSIFSDLEAGPSATNTFLATGPDWSNSGSRQVVNLSANGTYYVAYSEEGKPIGAPTAAAFDTGGGGNYGARVMIARDSVITNLSRVEVQVESPLSAPTNGRTKFSFVTLMPNNVGRGN